MFHPLRVVYEGNARETLSAIRRGFSTSFVDYKKGCTRLAATSDKVYQLLTHGWWFSLGTPVSPTTKTGLFCCECKLISYLTTMYVYCVYPAISKRQK